MAVGLADFAPAADSLTVGLTKYLPFDGGLESLNPAGVRGATFFGRSSPAYDPQLRRFPAHAARFLPARFGSGVLIEYGRCASGPNAARNALPAEIATAEAAPAGFLPVNGAELGRWPGAQGEWALRVTAAGPGAGFATRAVTAPKLPGQVFSVHLKGPPETGLEIRAAIDGQNQFLAQRDIILTGDWQQEFLSLDFDTEATLWQQDPGSTPPLVFSVVARPPTTFLADAMMLEPRQGYAGRRAATTWVEPGRSRDGEILQPGRLGAADNAGSIAFWAQLRGRMDWRTLLTLGDGAGWQVPLRLDVRNNQRLDLQMPNAKRSAQHPLADPFAWHHYALTWDGARVALHLDGEAVAELDDTQGVAKPGAVTLGGVANNFSPALRADAVFDEFARWKRALTAEEIERLASRDEPLGALFEVALAVEDRAPVKVFARDLAEYSWPLTLVNRTGQPLAGVVMSHGVPGLFVRRQSLPAIPAGGELPVAGTFAPARLMPGDYALHFAFANAAGTLLEYAADFAVAPMRTPRENAQVIAWQGHSQAMAEAGVTVGGIAGGSHGPPAHQVEEATRRGLYTQLRLDLSAGGETRVDHFIDAVGRQQGADQSTPAARAAIRHATEELAAALDSLPDVTHAILNCEKQWIWNVDFREETVNGVRERFGLDLERWRGEPVADLNRIQHPYGRLQPARGGFVAPGSGIIAVNDPFYAFSRWWQSGEPGNEVFLNDQIARLLRERVPHVQTIAEPALRRPAVRAFRDQAILNEWFYYPHPRRAAWVQEELAAAARGTPARIGGMPQFLFKPGMAAPYGGMPTPTLYREAVWHCLARPSIGLTYWNLWSALERGSAANVKTREEIVDILGATPAWEEAAAKTERRGEWSSIFLWIPELPEEIRRLHRELVHPLGALWPRWQNAPRRVAVYKSFAGQLFNDVRWPDVGALGEAVAATGLPFDVLFDQDFEEFPELLHSYAVVAVPEAPVITAPAAAALRAFAERGGMVVVDQFFKADLPGLVRLDFGDGDGGKALQRAERALLTEYGDPSHVLYIEGMEEARRQFAAAGGPLARVDELLREHATGEMRTATAHVSLNLLKAGAARYLTAVNRLAKPGPWYGHFGRIRDQGVEQTAEISIAAGLGTAAYRLDTGERLEMDDEAAGRRRLRLPLAPGGGAVVLLLPRPIAALEMAPMAGPTTHRPGGRKVADLLRRLLRVHTVKVARGQSLQLAASLTDAVGTAVPGVVPARVEILGPDGQPTDFSRYDAFLDGHWSLQIPIAFNQPPGAYRLTMTELASGRQARQTWSVE